MEHDSKSLRIAKVEGAPVREVVEVLEETLAQARAGKVRSLVAVFETGNPYETNSVCAWRGASVQMLIGEIERMKLILTMKLVGAIEVEESEEEDPDADD
jgi:hypothetical protein